MAVTNEFIQQVSEALEALGAKAVSNDSDVPPVASKETLVQDYDSYSMPMVRVANGTESYAKVTLQTLMDAIVDEVSAENGLMEGITQDQFNAIFYPELSSSSE